VAQDAEAARAAMRTHLANSRERRRRAFASAT
jgi:DNA-binding FadR family transcriptional regulator